MNLNYQMVLVEIFCLRYSSCIEYIIKKHETLATIPPIHAYINRINNGLVTKSNDDNIDK